MRHSLHHLIVFHWKLLPLHNLPLWGPHLPAPKSSRDTPRPYLHDSSCSLSSATPLPSPLAPLPPECLSQPHVHFAEAQPHTSLASLAQKSKVRRSGMPVFPRQPHETTALGSHLILSSSVCHKLLGSMLRLKAQDWGAEKRATGVSHRPPGDTHTQPLVIEDAFSIGYTGIHPFVQ